MSFAGVDYWAIVIAALAGNAAGAIWYGLLKEPWMAANGLTKSMIKSADGKMQSLVPYVMAMLAQLIMAAILAGIIGHLGKGYINLRNGVISGALCWLGFVFTTLTVNHTFALRKRVLLLIDGGYWLVVLLLMGGIIGWMGVK